MEGILALTLTESLHKRLSYLKGQVIITLSDYIRQNGLSAPAVTNAARRQTIPAFREKGCGRSGRNSFIRPLVDCNQLLDIHRTAADFQQFAATVEQFRTAMVLRMLRTLFHLQNPK